MTKVLMNTVLLEKNRWETGRKPSILVSDWINDFKENGFDGIELWENHALNVSEEELSLLQGSSVPVDVFNSYVRFDDQFEEERVKTAEIVKKLGVNRVKFNLGSSSSQQKEYVENLLQWKDILPQGCELLCECHAGTIMEKPEVAAQVFEELGSDQFGAIIHPFHAQTDLHSWFRHLSSKIVHAHVSLFEHGRFHLLQSRSSLVKERIQFLKVQKFTGSYSMEFTKGIAEEQENPRHLYENAVKDFEFLMDCLRGDC